VIHVMVESARHTAINTDPGAFLSVYSFHKIVREVSLSQAKLE
jgi:hypothetical protein